MAKPYFHPQAIVESSKVGEDTRVWAFAHILPGATIGRECNICDHVFIENIVTVGDRVTIKCGVQLWDGVALEDDVFVGPNATFTNDPFPRSKQYLDKHPVTLVRKGASIGANATILPGLTIEQGAMIGAGAVVTRNVPPFAIVVGNPGRIVGYAGTVSAGEDPPAANSSGTKQLTVAGAYLTAVPIIKDLRGNLIVREIGNGLPFVPKRFFIVHDVPSPQVRGEHAHKKLEQLLICISGSVSVVVDDGTRREEVLLDSPEKGLYLPPLVWGIQYRYSADAALLVLASDRYDKDDYIRNYDDFLRLTAGSKPPGK